MDIEGIQEVGFIMNGISPCVRADIGARASVRPAAVSNGVAEVGRK
jgi:hypothetical protein